MMVVKLHYEKICDRCNSSSNDLTGTWGSIIFMEDNLIYVTERNPSGHLEGKDLCPNCLKEIDDWLKNQKV